MEPKTDGNWRTKNAIVWQVGFKGSHLWVRIPAGTVTDLATIPWFARPVFRSADARYAKAALLHDTMLRSGWSPQTAAAEFRSALIADGVSLWRVNIMFLAVLIGTWR